MTHALGITGISGKRKAEMFDYIVDWLSDPDAAVWILRDLTTVEDTMDGEAIILMPRELREPLARLLADEGA